MLRPRGRSLSILAASSRLAIGVLSALIATATVGTVAGEPPGSHLPEKPAPPVHSGDDFPADAEKTENLSWQLAPAKTDPVSYDAATGAVVPEGGRLDAAPEPERRSSKDRTGSGSPFAPKAESETTWFPDQPLAGQDSDMGLWRQDFSASFPIAPVASGLISGTLKLGYEGINSNAILPDSGIAFPEELWTVAVGSNYMRKFENGWMGGGGVSFGSSSDQPFDDTGMLQISANGFLRVPQGERDAWLFSLFYAPMSEIPFPIPGVAYQWQPSEAFTANIGLPFSLNYTPTDRIAIEATYLPVRTVRARASYALFDSLKTYAGYEWSNRSWFLRDRLNDDDRLFAYDQRLSVGLDWTITEVISADLASGYAFDRFYFQGENYDDRNWDRIEVADGPFVALQFQGRW